MDGKSSKREMIENLLKTRQDVMWFSKIVRLTGYSPATVRKWLQILELEGYVHYTKIGNMKLLGWVE